MRSCPLCHNDKRVEYPYKTYKTCSVCDHTYQPRPPQKKYQNPDEKFNGGEGAVMGDHEKSINFELAHWLCKRFRPSKSLDIGCAYPYMAGCLAKMGVQAHAVDGVFKTNGYVPDDHTRNVEVYPVNWENPQDGGYDAWKGMDLITMVHVLEHFKDPIECLKRAYDNLSDDGVLYLRAPNKDIKGIERDHTEGHTLVHPNIFGNKSIKYAAAKVGFRLLWAEHMHGYGQSSWVFKKTSPKISLFMIVKNEEVNLPGCLESVKDVVDEMVVLDTGSTDKTIEIAKSFGAKVYRSKHFNSETKIEDFNFSTARNEAMSHATNEWLFWMDADDRLETTSLNLSPEFDVYHLQIIYGNTLLKQARIFRNHWGVRFKGAVHECPVIDSCRSTILQQNINHISGPKEGRVERNLALLNKEYKKDPTDKRTLFYLANACREAKKYDDAVQFYNEYINSDGEFYHDELVLARYYLALCYYNQNKVTKSLKTIYETLALDDRWGELYTLAGECYARKKQFKKAISHFQIAYEMPFPKTTLFIEKHRYRKAPKLWISYCYEKLGDLDKAKEWAKGNAHRERELSKRSYVIEVRRPGALGDVLCTTPALRALRRKYPEAIIRYITHKSSREVLKHNRDIDEVVEDIGQYADKIVEFAYPMHEGYPNKPMNRHLTQYFAECAGVKLESDRPVLNLLPSECVKLEHKKPIITFAVKTGWSEYKEWPLERWARLVSLFPKYQFIQLGATGEPIINGAQYMCGKLTLRESFSVLQQSTLFVGLDSVFNHACRALNVPAVIMFGSTSPIGSGYREHTNLWSDFECSPCYKENNEISVHPMPPCPYEHKCMKDFMTVDRVANAVREKLNIMVEN